MRLAPAAVPPVDLDGVRFSAPHFGNPQRGGYVEARDVKTGSALWILKIYTTKYDPSFEEDVQDVFIRRLEARGSALVITDERGREFHLDPATRTIVEKATVTSRIADHLEARQFQEAAALLDEFNPPDFSLQSRLAVYGGAGLWPQVVGLTSQLIDLGPREAAEILMEDYRDDARERSAGAPPIFPSVEGARRILASLPAAQLRSEMKAAYRLLKTTENASFMEKARGRVLSALGQDVGIKSHLSKVLGILRRHRDADAFLSEVVEMGEAIHQDLDPNIMGYDSVRARGRQWLATLAALL